MWFTGERDGWGDLDEDQALTTVSPFPTSLQVFASVGGLALLAEHLPLLYPEVSRQSILQESGLDYMIKNMSLAEEWSMVEPFPEDFYEVGCWFVESLSWRRYILWEKILQHASEPSYYCVHLVLYVEYLFSVWNNALKCDFFFPSIMKCLNHWFPKQAVPLFPCQPFLLIHWLPLVYFWDFLGMLRYCWRRGKKLSVFWD